MKKISLLLAVLTIAVCCWLVVSRLNYLDIPSNKNDYYAMQEIRKINERVDISECNKKLLTNQVNSNRANRRYGAGIAFQTQVTAFAIIGIQLVLIVFIALVPKKKDAVKAG